MQHVKLREIVVVGDVYLPHHAQILNGQNRYLALFQLVQTHASGEDGDSEVPPDKILYRRHVVYLKHDVEVAYAHVVALKVGDEQVARVGIRQTQDHALLLQLVERDHAPLCERVVYRHRKHEIIRIEQKIMYVRVGYPPLDDCEIKLIGVQHSIKITYSVSNHFNAYALVCGAVFGQRFGDGVALRRVRHAYCEMRCQAAAVAQILPQVIVQPKHFLRAFYDLLALLCHYELAVYTLKNAHAEFLLQRLYMLADGRLGDGQLLRRLGIAF